MLKHWWSRTRQPAWGGRNKGMRKTYADQFAELIEGKPWHVRGLEIGSELVYIVRK